MIVYLFKVIMDLGNRVSRDRHFPRIDTVELKLKIGKRLGPQKARKYFDLLNRYFSLKVKKSEFDKLCIGLLGRENVSLHNGLIRAIISNAGATEIPLGNTKEGQAALNVKVPNGYKQSQSSLQSLCKDVFPQSPRKVRTSTVHDRKLKDRPSPLGPHGKLGSVVDDISMAKVSEQLSATELLSLGSRPPAEVTSVEDGEEVVSGSPGINSRSPLRAPFGVSIHAKGTRKVLCHGSSPVFDVDTCYNNGELPNSSSLKKMLEQKSEMEGLNITLDCVNLLNNGLDVFMKRLLKPSLDLAGSRSEYKVLNKVHHQFKYSSMNGLRPVTIIQKPSRSFSVSMSDFRVALEANPMLLGEDWPLQLEKVSFHSSEDNMDE